MSEFDLEKGEKTMDLKRDVIPVTELKSHTREVLEKVARTGEPVLVTQKGRSAALIVDVEEYQRQQRRLIILEKIARGERDILEGKGISHAQLKAEVARWDNEK